MSTAWSVALATFLPIFHIVQSFTQIAFGYLDPFLLVDTYLLTHLSVVELPEVIIGTTLFGPILSRATLLLILV